LCLCDCFVSTRKMHRSIARVVQNDASLFFQSPIFFVSLSLSLTPIFKTLNGTPSEEKKKNCATQNLERQKS
jgi:hypothetical protein